MWRCQPVMFKLSNNTPTDILIVTTKLNLNSTQPNITKVGFDTKITLIHPPPPPQTQQRQYLCCSWTDFNQTLRLVFVINNNNNNNNSNNSNISSITDLIFTNLMEGFLEKTTTKATKLSSITTKQKQYRQIYLN